MCTILELNAGLCFEKLANSKLHLKNISYLEYAVAPHQLTCWQKCCNSGTYSFMYVEDQSALTQLNMAAHYVFKQLYLFRRFYLPA